jgi:hypothetical protein
MKEADEIAEHINNLLPDVISGTLRFFGEWFGRPYDNCHTIKAASTKDECLIITFDEKETLSIWNPSEFQITETKFQIKYASRVLWQWYCYGRPQTPENLYYFDYVFENSIIAAKTNVDWYKPELKPDLNEPAVKIFSLYIL